MLKLKHLSEENIGLYLHNLILGNGSLYITAKAYKAKEKYINETSSKLKTYVLQ